MKTKFLFRPIDAFSPKILFQFNNSIPCFSSRVNIFLETARFYQKSYSMPADLFHLNCLLSDTFWVSSLYSFDNAKKPTTKKSMPAE